VMDEVGMGSLVDERPDLVIHIPEAEERPQAPPIVIEDQRLPWFERREGPWIVLGITLWLIALLLLLPTQTVAVSATPQGGDGGTSAIGSAQPSWAALEIAVPETYRTHTVNVNGSVDALEVADLGPGAALPYAGAVATADGPTVQQIFSPEAFSISSPTGATVIAFMPYLASGTPTTEPDQQLTFVGTLLPVPSDFASMVGSEAASVGAVTGVYVSVVPETIATVDATQ
jgi:hypothetical protein